MNTLSRRNFLRNSAGLLVAAPFVVKAESLMKVRAVPSTAVPLFVLSGDRLGLSEQFSRDFTTHLMTNDVVLLPQRDFHITFSKDALLESIYSDDLIPTALKDVINRSTDIRYG